MKRQIHLAVIWALTGAVLIGCWRQAATPVPVPVVSSPERVAFGSSMTSSVGGSGGGGGTWGSITGTLSAQTDLNTALAAKAPAASPTFTGQSNFKVFGYSSVYANGNSGATPTVNWSNGNLQSITLNSATVTVSFTAPTYPGPLTLYVTQDATGGRSVTWPTIKWSGAVPGVITTTASATDVVTLQYDGTSYFAAVAIPDAR